MDLNEPLTWKLRENESKDRILCMRLLILMLPFIIMSMNLGFLIVPITLEEREGGTREDGQESE